MIAAYIFALIIAASDQPIEIEVNYVDDVSAESHFSCNDDSDYAYCSDVFGYLDIDDIKDESDLVR